MEHPTERDADLSRVYDLYADQLYRLSYSMLLSREDAEDAVHEVFMKYLHKLPRFSDGEHEKAWLLRVTINQCHDHARRLKYRSHLPLEEAAHFCSETGSGEVTEAVLLLEDKQKEVVLLHYFEGYRVEEIAQILRVSVSAVKMRLMRAREALRAILSPELLPEEDDHD